MRLVIAALTVALWFMWMTINTPFNLYDTLPTKCGHKLRETCPSTGVNWSK